MAAMNARLASASAFCAAAAFLPRSRKLFLCEQMLERDRTRTGSSRSSSASSIMADLTAKFGQATDDDGDGLNDVFDDAVVGGQGVKGDGGSARPSNEQALFKEIEPLDENYVGAWMGTDERYKGLPTAELLRKQGGGPLGVPSR